MIKHLRTKFIRIAMLSVALVLLVLSLIVNAANFISTNRDLNQTLDMIYENQGTIPTGRTAGADGSPSENPAEDDTPSDPATQSGKPQEDAEEEDHTPPPETDHTPPELEEKPDTKPSSQPERPRGPFNAETPYSTRYFYLRFDADGNLDSGNFSHIAAVTEDDADTYIKAALQHGAGYGFYTSGYKFRVVKEGESRYIAVFLDCYQELRAVRTVAVWSGVSYAVCLALVYVLVVLLSRRAIDPVVRASEQQKQFITDAGHELKTPITVIATNLRVLEMEVGQQKWIDKARAQTKKLRELVQSLITLCKYDEETSPLHPQTFAVSEAATDTAESFADFAQSKGHTISLAVVPGLSYCGDEAAVRQLVSILLDNAVKYAAPETEIRISLEQIKRGVKLTVTNTCDQPPEGDLNRLFDRFYRPDASRTAATGDFGIGLSIAKSIAEAHRGQIRASTQGTAISFIAELKRDAHKKPLPNKAAAIIV